MRPPSSTTRPASERAPIRVRRPARAGFTLVELGMTAALVALGMVGLSYAVTESVQTSRHFEEAAAALETSRGLLERIAALSPSEALATYGPAGAPGVAADAIGPDFVVEGLEPLENDEDGRVGEIFFPLGFDGEGKRGLVEDLDLPALGMPCDLNADGVIDSKNHSGDYALLPIGVRVRWTSASGPSVIELKTILTDI